MFDHLVRFLTGADGGLQSGQQNDAAFALAVLLIEVARSDDRVEAREQSLIALALARRFGLDRSEVASLVAAAKEGAIKATALHHFTQVVVGSFNEEERIGVIEMLWDVAYSDSVLTGDEDALIRRVAGLIYVSDWERGEAKRSRPRPATARVSRAPRAFHRTQPAARSRNISPSSTMPRSARRLK